MLAFGKRKFLSLLPSASFSATVLSLSGVLMFITVGHLLGESALAAVNIANPPITAVAFVASLLSLGTSVVRGLALGRGDRDAADRVFSTGLFAAAGAGLVLAAAFVLFGDPIIDLLGAGAEISRQAKVVLRGYTPAFFTTPLTVVLLTAVIMDGGAKIGAVASGLRVLVQFALQIALLQRFGIIMTGVAVFASDLATIALLGLHFRSVRNSLRLTPAFSFAALRRIVASSIGDAGATLCGAVINLVLIAIITRFYGDAQLAVLACYMMALNLVEVMNGVGNALAPVVSVYVGECNPRAVVSVSRLAELVAIGEGLVATVFFLAFPEVIIKLIGLTPGELPADVLTLIRLAVLGFTGQSLACLYNTYYICIERPGLSALVCYLEGLLLPAALTLAFGWIGPVALWTAIGVAPLAAIAVFAAILLFILHRHPLAHHGCFPLMVDDARAEKITMFSLKTVPEEIVAAAQRVRELTGVYRAGLLTEEALMAVRDHNGGRALNAEVALDFNDGVLLTLRDDGDIFDITDEDRRISSLRSYLVSTLMSKQKVRQHFLTTGFNRNIFRFQPITERKIQFDGNFIC